MGTLTQNTRGEIRNMSVLKKKESYLGLSFLTVVPYYFAKSFIAFHLIPAQ